MHKTQMIYQMKILVAKVEDMIKFVVDVQNWSVYKVTVIAL